MTPSGTALPGFASTASSPQYIDSFKSIAVASPTFLAAHWSHSPGAQGGHANVTLPGSGFDAALYLRPAFQNASTTGTVTLYHASLWLYRGGL